MLALISVIFSWAHIRLSKIMLEELNCEALQFTSLLNLPTDDFQTKMPIIKCVAHRQSVSAKTDNTQKYQSTDK